MVERKVATVLFADLVDSTGLVASADPEVVRRRVERYFDVVASRIEAYGGTVEKFAGDAVMAAFGVPIAHEDDAERAVRAALEIVPKVEELQLSVRIGVESGEIVIGDSDSTFATGEAVNLAARLQQAAQPGEILLGSAARRLAASAVEVDDAGPLEVKGRTEPLWTWRAIRAHDSSRLDAAPFVGREPELELLENSFSRAVKDRRAQLLTIFGEPGLGKTRLVTEFTAGLERATTLCGRTLPYGEGVTYWPLASMIKASAGIRDDDPASEAFEKLRACCESEAVADLLGAALGVLGAAEGGEHEPGQLSWAALRWAEQLADAQPLVLVFEDVHWAEEPLLDLIEDLARSLREVPVLIIALARPELLDARPAWGGGIRTATAVDLAPLDGNESGELADALLSRGNVSAAERGPLLERAEGNPLFLEEIVQALREGCGLDGIPETLQALIAARIDGLAAGEKHVLQSAALVGRVFWQGALESLVPDLQVAELLDALCSREFLLREEHSTISGDVAFRFKHGLIRDVAYGGMSKVRRAQEHQAFAAWVEERARDELAEIRAHHLEQAAELLTELDGAVPADLALSAATALEEAGRRALRRGALGVARRTLLRAVELDPSPERRYLAAHAAWRLADVPTVGDEAEEALAEARAVGRHDVEGRALVLLADLALHSEGDVERAHDLADEALAILPEDEPAGLYDAHALITMIFWWLGDGEGATRHAEAMLDLAHRAGRPELESLARTQLSAIAGVRGDTAGAVALLEEAESLAESSGSREAMGYALAVHGRRFGESEFDEAEHYLRRALEIFEEIGAAGRYGWTLSNLASVYRQRGELPLAEKTFREAVRRLRKTHEQGFLVEAERGLAEVLVEQGKVDEADRLVADAERRVGRDDVWTRASLLHARGLVLAAQGRTESAESAFRQALEIIEPTMYAILTREIRRSLESLRATDDVARR
ncbi:MAG TPA: tetratricopeptide repeat protein [Gaiellaceae bacterium]|nr:tetratricopeptide repeat protein [Gaiellaceae bacterium]